MAEPPKAPAHVGEPEGAALLESLGYRQELKRSVNILGNLALVISDITPTASLLIIGSVVVATAGTGSVWAYLIGSFVAVNVALCMGELGSMFPVAGGLFSIVTRVLGKPIGFLAMLDYIGQAIFLPASVAIGIGVYINSLYPSVKSSIAAGIAMIVVTAICLLQIRFNAVLTGFFLALEMLVIIVLTFVGFAHLNQPVSILTHPVVASGTNGLSAVGLGVIFTAVATAMFSVNGYDSAINFSEETEGSAAVVGRAVVIAAITCIIAELIPFIAVVFAAKSTRGFVHSSTPLTDVVRAYYGSGLVTAITWGAIIAFFNASIAITLQFARITWASGRDNAWPGPINRWLGKVEPRRGAPWVATLVVGALAAVLCFQSSLISVVTFTAVLLIVLYALIAISALVSRVTQRHLPRPSRMRLWPIPPLIALAGVGIALTQQKGRDLLIVAAIFAFGLIYYYGFIRPRQDRYWNMDTNPERELARLAQHPQEGSLRGEPSS